MVWPAVIALFAVRRSRRRTLLAIAGGLALASALLRGWLWHGGASVARVYYGSDVRADSLFVGCALALVVHAGHLPRGRAAVLAVKLAAWLSCALLVVLVMQVRMASGFLYLGGLTLVAVAVASLLGETLVSPRGLLARVLGVRPLRAVGRISYGLYLWHWPVFLIANAGRLHLSTGATRVADIALAFAFALASYFLIERPFLAWRRRFEPRTAEHREIAAAAV